MNISDPVTDGDGSLQAAAAAASIGPRSSNLLHYLGQAVANAFAGLVAAAVATAWLCVGAVTGFPRWWEVALYSTSAMVTFVMVFVIQHTQAKQIVALQRKLDELILSSHRADNSLISIEQAPELELRELADAYRDHRHVNVADDSS